MKPNYSTYLEPYSGKDSRHECPQCHDTKSFTYYLDSITHSVIDTTVGRCNHESSCGYHYTPKEYYKEHPKSGISRLKAAGFKGKCERDNGGRFIPPEYLIRSKGKDSNFVAFLEDVVFSEESNRLITERLVDEYHLGYTKDKAVIFWQIDTNNFIRTGKIMQYNPVTGKRLKDSDGSINWVHTLLKKDREFSEFFNLNQCLFGQHLIKRYPNHKVALVESEKTAIICSGIFPGYVWLATGGKSQLSEEKLEVLKGRRIVMFPDVDGYYLWKEKAEELRSWGHTVVVSDLLERNATSEDRENKIDIADWLIKEQSE